MGNKLGRRRQAVDERYTKPQGLYVHKDVDHKKLRKLILESKLAPCYPGDEEYSHDQEECPICFLCYPSLNRSRCCMKGICTECFLQMKNPNSTRPTQCPFCKTSNYAVEYRGVKTKEEKGLEQIEEQRVIEAKIRMRQQELQDDEERMQKRLELCSSRTTVVAGDVECSSTTDPSDIPSVESDEIVPSHNSIRHPPPSRVTRDDDFDLDLEDIMVMEAIWLSIQENGRQRYPVYGDPISSEQYAAENRDASSVMDPQAGSSSSPSGGLACAIAALAERQQMSTDYSVHNNENSPSLDMLPGSSSFCNRMDRDAGNYPPAQGSTNLSPECRTPMAPDDGEWGIEGSEAAEVGTSYASSDTTEDVGGISTLLPPRPTPPLPAADAIGYSFGNVPGSTIPESFEDQMMLAIVFSLAEAGAMANGPGSTWQ